MDFQTKKLTAKDGRTVLLRCANSEDAEEMLEYICTCCGETDYLLKYPEEYADVTVDMERCFLERIIDSPDNLMIVAEVDGEIAGNCQIEFNNRIKTAHRSSIAISLLQKFWNIGIGTAMIAELTEIARQRGCRQMELDYISGNNRALALYEKTGFVAVARKPDTIKFKNGSFADEIFMVKQL